MGISRNHRVYEFEGYRLDAAHLMLYRAGEEIPLGRKAVETLFFLVEGRGQILSKSELMSAIWSDSIVEESNLAQYLHILRKTLGNQPNGKPFIETLRGRGYRFDGSVKVSESVSNAAPLGRLNAAGVGTTVAEDALASIIPAHRTQHVQKRGNVLALADWREDLRADGKDGRIVAPRKEAERSLPWRIAAIAAILAVVAIPIIWLVGSGLSRSAAVPGDITFTVLTNGEAVDNATISPDGRYFVYASHDGERSHLWLQQTGQGQRIEIIPPFNGAITGLTFTPDAKHVYFLGETTTGAPPDLYRVPALGGEPAIVLTDVLAPVSFSPDGGEMVFTRGDNIGGRASIIIATSDGLEERTLLANTGNQVIFGGGEWSPDGRLIAYGVVEHGRMYSEGGCRIVGTDIFTGKTTELSPEKWDTCYRMVWTRDGEGIIFVGTKFQEAFSTRRDQIYYLNVATGEARRLTTDGSRHQHVSLGVTTGNELLVLPFNRSSQLWSIDADGDSRLARQLTRGVADGRGGIATIGANRVAYLARNGDGFGIWVYGIDTAERILLTSDPQAMEELRAPADGSFFIFSAKREGYSHLYRRDADGSVRQLTFGESYEIDSTISPDGKWIIYTSKVQGGNDALWRIESSGGQPILLADVDCETPHFSPDGEQLSCVSEREKSLLVISARDGSVKRIFPAVGNAVLNVGARWTADGKGLAYITYHNYVGNLMIQPTGGARARPLTNFTSGDIYNFAFSAAGEQLYLARGQSTRNPVLIRNYK